jgi:hypothetical protein
MVALLPLAPFPGDDPPSCSPADPLLLLLLPLLLLDVPPLPLPLDPPELPLLLVLPLPASLPPPLLLPLPASSLGVPVSGAPASVGAPASSCDCVSWL